MGSLAYSKFQVIIFASILSFSLQNLQTLFTFRDFEIYTVIVNLIGAISGANFMLLVTSFVYLMFYLINNLKTYEPKYQSQLPGISSLVDLNQIKPMSLFNIFIRKIHFGLNKLLPASDNLKLFIHTDTSHKLQFPVMSPSIIRHLLYGTSEFDTSVILSEQLKPGMIVCDLGAHYGYFSCKSSDLVGPTGKVFSIEPTPSTFKVLKKNTQTINNIFVFNTGFFSQNITLTFNDYGENYSALNSLHQARLAEGINSDDQYLIKFQTADSFFTQHKFIPDFIKMDCESSELQILKGMKKLFSLGKPYLLIEFGDIDGKNTPKSKPVHEYLVALGYTGYIRCKEGYYMKNLSEKYSYANILFVPPRHKDSFLISNPIIANE